MIFNLILEAPPEGVPSVEVLPSSPIITPTWFNEGVHPRISCPANVNADFV